MRDGGEHSFDVYVGRSTLVREVSLRTAYVIARHHADARRQPVCIRNRATEAVDIVGPTRLAPADGPEAE